ncbi:MAG TPA: hypothetical protein VFN02_14635 [Ktedonobacteraceae bacterium]|nr:hypothetical protein [Ktedonobacteraceae bacterium]
MARRVCQVLDSSSRYLEIRNAARFTQRLKDLIESGDGLPDSTVESELDGAKGDVR